MLPSSRIYKVWGVSFGTHERTSDIPVPKVRFVEVFLDKFLAIAVLSVSCSLHCSGGRNTYLGVALVCCRISAERPPGETCRGAWCQFPVINGSESWLQEQPAFWDPSNFTLSYSRLQQNSPQSGLLEKGTEKFWRPQ
jgi:hypothetical protein